MKRKPAKNITDRQPSNRTVMFRLIAIYLILINLTTYAQTSIQNISLTNPDLTILYVGIDNIIVFNGQEADSTIKLVSTTGQAIKWSNKFIVRHSSATTDTLRVYLSDKLLTSQIYDVKIIGSPIAQLGNIKDTFTTIQEILIEPTINAVIPDCYYDHRFRVVSFSISITNKDDKQILRREGIQNNQLDEKIKKIISTLKSGDRIKLTNITATCPDCALRRLNNIDLTIK
jgi:hypothetical protein